MSEFEPLLYFVALFIVQVPLVMALVELCKKFVPAGNWRIVAALVAGLLIGGLCLSLGYDKLVVMPLHQQIPLGAFFLLVAGLSAAGFYDLRKGA